MLIRHFKNKGCLFLIIFLISSLSPSVVSAVPHIAKKKQEPYFERKIDYPKARLLDSKKLSKTFFAPPPTPTPNILFLRVDFTADADDTTTGTGEWGNCGDPSCPGGDADYWVDAAAAAMPGYWTEVSYGNLTVNVTVSNVYTLAHPMSYYGGETAINIENLAVDAITLADADVGAAIDFSLYDAVLIVHAGAGEETDALDNTSNDIWSLYYSDTCISTNNVDATCLTADSTQINEIILMPQTGFQDGIEVNPFGVYAHEFGHWLGLPDLYCTASSCTLDGVGDWSLMDYGPYNDGGTSCAGDDCYQGSVPAHPDAWSKVYLGWITPQTLSNSSDPVGDQTLDAVETNQDVIKLQASSTEPSQYFLLENRQLTGYDKGLPGSGLLVWLIDQGVIDANISANTVNNSATQPGVKLIEADGDFNLMDDSDGDMGTASDPYPGTENNTSLTPHSSPASTPYTNYAWVNIKDITEAAGVVTFGVGFSPEPPLNLASSSKTLSWTANSETDLAYYKLYKNYSVLTNPTGNSYTDVDAESGDLYSVRAVDTNGYESLSSNSVTVTVVAATDSSGGGGGACFIATAAYGSYLDPHVQILRNFRDKYLLTNSPGRMFVNFYYSTSPPIADYIARHKVLRTLIRFLLTPVVYLVKYPILMLLMLFFAGIFLFYERRERGGKKIIS